jgi:hypothetical protein
MKQAGHAVNPASLGDGLDEHPPDPEHSSETIRASGGFSSALPREDLLWWGRV